MDNVTVQCLAHLSWSLKNSHHMRSFTVLYLEAIARMTNWGESSPNLGIPI